jgi:predicted double-glycine peptidase
MSACLRTVLEHLGVTKSEEELRGLTDSGFDSKYSPGGTDALRIVDVAKQLGFRNTTKNNLKLQQLVGVLSQGHFPIVQIGIRLKPNTPVQAHAVVIIEINERGMLMCDPMRGEVLHSQEDFDQMWKRQHRLTIIVE